MSWGAQIHLASATLNQTVGDWEGNLHRIGVAIESARARGAKLLALPEMCIPGYSLGDRLLREGTLRRSWAMLREVARLAEGVAVCAGLPVSFEGVIYNAMALVMDGEIHGLVCKENLATGDVEYESRWYQHWISGLVAEFESPDGSVIPIGNLLFKLGDTTHVAMEICEDGWMGLRPGSRYAIAGAEVLVNPSASWFTIGKHAVRRRMCEQISLEDHCTYMYTSLAGCDATRLIFDGSAFITCEGKVVREARRFVFDADVEVIDVIQDLRQIRQRRMENGSWRQQVHAMNRGEHGLETPHIVEVPGDFDSPTPASADPPYWLPELAPPVDASLEHLCEAGLVKGPLAHGDLSHLELELALCMGLRDYLSKTGVRGYCLALSGGRDSAMVAALVARMHRYDKPDLDAEALAAHIRQRFVCAYMATVNSSQATRDAARAIAEELGAEFLDGDIDDIVGSVRGIGQGMLGRELSWEVPSEDLALQNVQARARSVLIWLIANIRGFVLLATSNKSEAAVGYTTMDGDTSGGLSPIADVPKSLIQIWLAWARHKHGLDAVDKVLAKPASAELRPLEQAQTDEDDLMPFEVLDQLMDHFVQKAMEPKDIFERLWPVFKDRYRGDKIAFADHIAKFVRMLCRAQWKRERFAISFRVMPFDLDPKGGFRFPPVQKGFSDELAEMFEMVRRST